MCPWASCWASRLFSSVQWGWQYFLWRAVFVHFFNLAAPGLSCSMWDHQSSLWHMGFVVAACELLAVACGIWLPDQELIPGPLHWEHGFLANGPPGKSPQYPLTWGHPPEPFVPPYNFLSIFYLCEARAWLLCVNKGRGKHFRNLSSIDCCRSHNFCMRKMAVYNEKHIPISSQIHSHPFSLPWLGKLASYSLWSNSIDMSKCKRKIHLPQLLWYLFEMLIGWHVTNQPIVRTNPIFP